MFWTFALPFRKIRLPALHCNSWVLWPFILLGKTCCHHCNVLDFQPSILINRAFGPTFQYVVWSGVNFRVSFLVIQIPMGRVFGPLIQTSTFKHRKPGIEISVSVVRGCGFLFSWGEASAVYSCGSDIYTSIHIRTGFLLSITNLRRSMYNQGFSSGEIISIFFLHIAGLEKVQF